MMSLALGPDAGAAPEAVGPDAAAAPEAAGPEADGGPFLLQRKRSSPVVDPLKKHPSRPTTLLQPLTNPLLHASRHIYILLNMQETSSVN